MHANTADNEQIYSKKSLKWLRQAIRQNFALLKSYDLNYACATEEEVENFEKNKLFELFLETKRMQKDLNMRLGRV